VTILSFDGYAPDGLFATDEVVPSKLLVDLPSDTWATMLRIVVPVRAGDVLDVESWARVSNALGYTVGVGYHLWVYDVDNGQGASGPWTRISPLKGDNVDKPRHHLPIDTSCVWQVPADWPEGHRIVVAMRADAHSTAWTPDDYLTVDRPYGHLTVRRWRPIS
jgi:hypothetical protein